MKFLLDNDLPEWMISVFEKNGYQAVHIGTLGMSRAADPVVAEYAQRGQWAIVTGDFDFADIRNYDPRKFESIIILYIPRDRGSAYMRLLLDRLFDHLRTPAATQGKLLIIEGGRIRIRE